VSLHTSHSLLQRSISTYVSRWSQPP